MMAILPQETIRQYLVHSLRAYLASEVAPLAAPQTESERDALLKLTAFHRVAPLFHKCLQEISLQTPLPKLEAYVRTVSIRGLLLTSELLRLLKHWEATGIETIPFKGSALAASLYGDPTLRHFDDLDVVVRKEEFQAAREIVFALGYQPRELHSYHESFTLLRGNMEIVLELHWDFMPMPNVFPFNPHFDEAVARCETVSVGGYKALAFAPEDQLLYLCAHGSRHRWFRLQWICDVAQLLRTRRNLDWPRLMAQVKSSGGQRMLFLGMSLAHDFFGAPLPPAMVQTILCDRHTVRLTRQIKSRYFEEPLEMIKPWKESLFPLQLIDHSIGRLTYLPKLWWHKLS